jgi:predicted Zn-dependent protease
MRLVNARVWAMALLALCGVAIAIGNVDRDVSLDSVRELWADLLRDADRAGMKAAPVTASKEQELGGRLALRMSAGFYEDPAATAYVSAVGSALTPHVRRRNIAYRFHVVQSPLVNAFALPGGEVYVTSGMLGFVKTEAELAAVVGHEIAHVDARHAIDRYRFEAAAARVGAGKVGAVVDLARRPAEIAYQQFEEFEADARGLSVAVAAGYDPRAAADLFARMGAGERAAAPASTPGAELARSAGGFFMEYFRSHPRSREREERLKRSLEGRKRHLAGRTYYRGVSNLAAMRARSVHEDPRERVKF